MARHPDRRCLQLILLVELVPQLCFSAPPQGEVYLRVPPPRKGPSPEDPRQCESVGINSDRRGAWGMVSYGVGNE